MLKVGIVGLGGIGNTHADVYHRNPHTTVVALCDRIPERAEQAAARFGGRAYFSVEEMLAHEELDLVGICTAGVENGGDHYEPTMQALEAGKHVLGEKPISNNIVHAREMVAKAWEKGVYYGINLNHRFTPPAAKAKQWIQEGRLGQLLLMNMTLWIDNPNETSPWFHIRALHPHSLDIMRYFCGPVKKVQAFFNRGPRPDGTPRVCWSNVQVNLLFENEVVGHLTGSYDANPAHNLERAEVMGSEGRFVLDNCFQELTLYPRRSPELTVIRNSIMGGMTGFGETFDRRINRFVEQVIAGVPREAIEASGEDGLAVQEIIEAAIRSWENGTVEEVKG